jgi:hypothetical protein
VGDGLAAVGLTGLALVQLWQVAGTRPYFMAYYDPLLGGARTARDLIVVGWGEGMDVVARHLDALPNADSLTVATFYNSVFAAQFRGTIMSPNTYQPVSADYALLYVNVSQRSLADRLRAAIRDRDPYMSVRINGLEFVTAYRIEDDSVGSAVPAEFGHAVRLTRYRLENPGAQPGTAVVARLRWKVLEPWVSADAQTYLDLVRSDGWVAYRVAAPLSGDRPQRQWRTGEETVLTYSYVVPSDLPSGRYRLLAGVRGRLAGAPLQVTGPPALSAPTPPGYGDSVVLATFQHD